MKTKAVVIRITEEQEKMLIHRAQAMGFQQKSDYIRYVLFMKKSVDQKIHEIYDAVVR